MPNELRPDEVRIVIRPVGAPVEDTRLIPVRVFASQFNALLAALKAANAALSSKKSSEFLISHLHKGSNEVGVVEHPGASGLGLAPAIEFFKRCFSDVYHSEYARVHQYPKMSAALIKIGRSVDDNYSTVAQFCDVEYPVDAFFRKQSERLLPASRVARKWFCGSAITSFDGKIGEIDYRGSIWTGHLLLSASDRQIQCIFDKARGEDAYNRYGNKRVSITGRAIYTGDSALPERIEVFRINEHPRAESYVDIRGSLGKTRTSGRGEKVVNLRK